MKLFDIGNNYQMNMYKRMLNACYGAYGAYGASRWNMTDNDRAMRAMRRYIENDIESTARLADAVGFGIAVLNHQCKSILPHIKDVIFNRPATIVFWADGSKTVVKCSKNDVYDPEKGLAMAIVKKAYGNKGNYYKVFSTWVEPELKYYSKYK